jgi:SAM-dependent methyltransferase
LTDVETCYKAVRTVLLQSIPLRSNDFRIEIELTMKLAKRGAHVFEVPIRYLPRSYREGKKIRAYDGVMALTAFMKFAFVDDVYKEDEYGSQILHRLERTRRFNTWMGDVLRPLLGDRILEIGAGIGTLTSQFIPRDRYVASDVNANYLHFLKSYALGKPYLQIRKIDATCASDFNGLERTFDTVVLVNVLEHVGDEQQTLANIRSTLTRNGRVVILVPQHPALYSSLDEALGHRERYTRDGLHRSLERAGFIVERILDFNRVSVPGWWLNGKILKRKVFSRVQLKIFDTAVPLLRHLDRWLPYGGQSLIAVALRPD